MNTRTSAIGVAGAMAVTAGLIAVAPAAQAGTTWGSAQEVSSKLGRSVSVSKDGTVAAWIRTNRATGAGPVRTAYYRSTKKGWTSSAELPGTVGSTDLHLSSDGNTAMIEVPGTGYLMSTRTGNNTWSTASPIVSGAYLDQGEMSDDAKTVVFADYSPDPNVYPSVAVPLKATMKQADGTWSAPVTVGEIDSNTYYSQSDYVAMSRDGSTLVYMDNTWALKATVKAADGTWSAPVLLKQFTSNPYLGGLQLSADGGRVAFYFNYGGEEGVVTATRSGTTWAPLSYVTVEEISGLALSPNGNVAAYGNGDGQMSLRTWNGTKWTKAKVMGTASQYDTLIALSNKTLAWSYSYAKTLRTSVYAKGAWKSSVKIASNAGRPSLNYNGRTLLWGSTSSKKIYSVKR